MGIVPASGMSIADMREYVRSGLGGERDVRVRYLAVSRMNDCGKKHRFLSCGIEFLRTKVAYWRAVKGEDVSRKQSAWLRHALSLSVRKPGHSTFIVLVGGLMPAPNPALLGHGAAHSVWVHDPSLWLLWIPVRTVRRRCAISCSMRGASFTAGEEFSRATASATTRRRGGDGRREGLGW